MKKSAVKILKRYIKKECTMESKEGLTEYILASEMLKVLNEFEFSNSDYLTIIQNENNPVYKASNNILIVASGRTIQDLCS